MTPSDYLIIEAAIRLRIQKQWANPAQSIARHVYAGEYDKAKDLALAIDLSQLKIKDYVIAVLKTAAAYGAMWAGTEPNFLKGPIYGEVADRFMLSLQHVTSPAIQQGLLHAIATLQERPDFFDDTTKKESKKDRFVREFVSYGDDSDKSLRLIASLHTSRLTTWGFTAEAELLRITKYVLAAVLDGRTSNYCRFVANGREFEVVDAREKILQVLNAPMEDIKNVQPWPKQSKAEIERLKGLSSEELTALGFHIPPFHPECRTLCIKKESHYQYIKPTTVVEPTVLPDIVEGKVDVPPTKEPMTKEIADSIELDLKEPQVRAWNDNLITAPTETLAELTNKSVTQIADDVLGRIKQRHKAPKNRSLTLQFEEVTKGISPEPSAKYSYNISAADSQIIIKYIDLIDQPDPEKILASMIKGAMKVGQANKLATLAIPAEDELAWLLSIFGFTSKPNSTLRKKLTKKLESLVTLAPNLIPPEHVSAINTIINSPNLAKVGLKVLARYPLRVNDKPLGRILMEGLRVNNAISLTDTRSIAMLTSYLENIE